MSSDRAAAIHGELDARNEFRVVARRIDRGARDAFTSGLKTFSVLMKISHESRPHA